MNDKFEARLLEQKGLLQDCQKEKGLKSCLNCDEVFSCIVRKSYVDAVYNSMNKGHTGGFDF